MIVGGQNSGRWSLYKGEKTDKMAQGLALLGYTDAEIALTFDVSETTINNWKLEHPSFAESLAGGKEEADINVVQSIYKRAQGYKYDEVTTEGDKVVRKVTKEVTPDTAAAFIWLKNRQGKKWRDKQEIENTNLNLNVDIPDDEEELKKMAQALINGK